MTDLATLLPQLQESARYVSERFEQRDARATGAPLASLNEPTAESPVGPYDVLLLDIVPLADPTSDTMPSGQN